MILYHRIIQAKLGLRCTCFCMNWKISYEEKKQNKTKHEQIKPSTAKARNLHHINDYSILQ